MPGDVSGGPWDIVAQLVRWAEATAWCQWVELAGSLGRGAGDARSDVDAGIGIAADQPFAQARDEALSAASAFAVVADSLIQPFGSDPPAEHLAIQYADGRQLSLVVTPAHLRPGLPPGARAVFDRTGRLAVAWRPDSLVASLPQQREWAFLAWWALLDTAKHSARQSLWRAITALDEARSLTWKLHAAALGVEYPIFGAVSVENAGKPPPAGLDRSLPARPNPGLILSAANQVAAALRLLSAGLDVDQIQRLATQRLFVESDAG